MPEWRSGLYNLRKFRFLMRKLTGGIRCSRKGNTPEAAQLLLSRLCTTLVLVVLFPLPLWAQATLENPQPSSFQSGIRIISGWVCEANRIEIVFDEGAPLEAAYGTSRGDTYDRCGDTNNGFGLLFNWNLLGDGSHTVRALADGMEFAQETVTVTTLGTPFLQGVSREVSVSDFPEVGTDVVLRWQQAQQNFVITDGSSGRSGGTDGSPPRVLEIPQPGSFQSGIGVISGWVCEANRIEITFDGGSPIEAAYGTSRGDTRGACSDTDNGFGLLFNWNLLGDGSHTVRALADGVEFAQATVTVATLGTPFLQGASRQDTLESVRQSLQERVTLPTDLGFDDPERLDLSLLFSGRFRTLRPFIPVFDSGCRTISIPTANMGTILRGSLTADDAEFLFQSRTGVGGTFFPLRRFPDPTFGGTTPDLTQRDINKQLLKGKTYYADCYTFAGTAGQTLSLRVQSTAFDTVLFLIGPDGRVVEDNDQCPGDGDNSCLPYDTLEGGKLALPSSGSYTIEVSSYLAEEGGDYTLTIEGP